MQNPKSKSPIRVVITCILLLLATPAAFARRHPNFAGRRELNKAKSSPVGQMQNCMLVIEHNDPTVKINRTEKYADGERVSNPLNLTTDGKLGYYTQFGGKNRQNFQAPWEGAKLVVKWNQDRGPMGQETETWMLSPNGKALTITTMSIAPDGKFRAPTSSAGKAGKPVTTKIVMGKQ